MIIAKNVGDLPNRPYYMLVTWETVVTPPSGLGMPSATTQVPLIRVFDVESEEAQFREEIGRIHTSRSVYQAAKVEPFKPQVQFEVKL